jgi:hypothetical protein
MSKHLSSHDIARIVEVIEAMNAPITRERVEKAIKRKLQLERSRWGLRENAEIKAAYDARRKTSNPSQAGTFPPPNYETKLSVTIKQLEGQNHALREQLAIILGNAVEMGVPLERMERPPIVIDYCATPGRR